MSFLLRILVGIVLSGGGCGVLWVTYPVLLLAIHPQMGQDPRASALWIFMAVYAVLSIGIGCGKIADATCETAMSDLRIMHAKVMELYACVETLRRHHGRRDVLKYADSEVLTDDITRADKIYQFFVGLAEQTAVD